MIERVSYYVKALLLSQTGMSGGGHDVRLFDVILARFRRLVSFFFLFFLSPSRCLQLRRRKFERPLGDATALRLTALGADYAVTDSGTSTICSSRRGEIKIGYL